MKTKINSGKSHLKINHSKNKHLSNQTFADENFLWVGGKNSCLLILKNRQRDIFDILITQNNWEYLNNFLKKNSLEYLSRIIKVVDNKFLSQNFRSDFIHQGIAIRVSKLKVKTQFELLEDLNQISDKKDLPNLLILDQITDPQNVGAIIRSAVAFDFKKIIFCEYNSCKESSLMIKASAGNIEFAELYIAKNINNLMEKLKMIGYWCVGLASEGIENEKQIEQYKNIALIVGSEGDGIRRLVKKNCDILIRIKTNTLIESLNVSVATAIALNKIYHAKHI